MACWSKQHLRVGDEVLIRAAVIGQNGGYPLIQIGEGVSRMTMRLSDAVDKGLIASAKHAHQRGDRVKCVPFKGKIGTVKALLIEDGGPQTDLRQEVKSLLVLIDGETRPVVVDCRAAPLAGLDQATNGDDRLLWRGGDLDG